MDSSQIGSVEATEDQIDETYAVRRRLRTLLDLAVAIGKREGLIGNNGNPTRDYNKVNNEGGSDVSNKRRV